MCARLRQEKSGEVRQGMVGQGRLRYLTILLLPYLLSRNIKISFKNFFFLNDDKKSCHFPENVKTLINDTASND